VRRGYVWPGGWDKPNALERFDDLNHKPIEVFKYNNTGDFLPVIVLTPEQLEAKIRKAVEMARVTYFTEEQMESGNTTFHNINTPDEIVSAILVEGE
jgi:molybdopterin-guanine dinucleotide biosynthesis protein A